MKTKYIDYGYYGQYAIITRNNHETYNNTEDTIKAVRELVEADVSHYRILDRNYDDYIVDDLFNDATLVLFED